LFCFLTLALAFFRTLKEEDEVTKWALVILQVRTILMYVRRVIPTTVSRNNRMSKRRTRLLALNWKYRYTRFSFGFMLCLYYNSIGRSVDISLGLPQLCEKWKEASSATISGSLHPTATILHRVNTQTCPSVLDTSSLDIPTMQLNLITTAALLAIAAALCAAHPLPPSHQMVARHHPRSPKGSGIQRALYLLSSLHGSSRRTPR
jgi:hypothetical protein